MQTLFKKQEAAELLRVSPRTINNMIARGDLEKIILSHKAVRVSGRSLRKLIGVPLEVTS
jgi:hypothetical protein